MIADFENFLITAERSGVLPNAEQTLLLKACISSENEAIEAYQEWKFTVGDKLSLDIDHPELGLPQVYDQLDFGSQRLMSHLYARFSRITPNDSLIRQLRSYYKYVWYKNQMLKAESHIISHELQSAGIQCFMLKGLSYIEQYYTDIGARPTVDLDLYVNRVDWSHAVGIFKKMGWAPKFNQAMEFPNSLTHACAFKKGEIEVDLHFHFSHYALSQDTQDRILECASGQYLHPAHNLFCTLLHGLSSSPIPPIRWVADAALIVRSFTKNDWVEFMYIVQLSPIPTIMVGLHFLVEQKFVDPPDGILDDMFQSTTSLKHKRFSFLKLQEKEGNHFHNLSMLFEKSKAYHGNYPRSIASVIRHYSIIWDENIWRLIPKAALIFLDKFVSPKRPLLRK